MENQTDSVTGKRVGYWKEFFPSGELWSEGYYVDGRREGYWKEYDINGDLESEGPYVNGRRNGPWKEYNRGKLYSEGFYINGIEEGMWKFYGGYNNRITAEANYINGTAEGFERIYYPNGNVKHEGYTFSVPDKGVITSLYFNAKDYIKQREGLWRIFYENGKLEKEIVYVQGKPRGLSKEYDPSGDLFRVTFLVPNIGNFYFDCSDWKN